MSDDNGLLKTQTLLPEEIEKLLENDFGSKIQPVDNGKLEKQRQKQAGLASYKNKSRKP
ncbi:MAG: hypothetical protein P4N59_12445 [Negativicutes bacterium]|nr:hypothetical protein [Negativicutes bacterium]